ncbi:MAG: DUF6879 family protein [Patescibacteria group bacterium]
MINKPAFGEAWKNTTKNIFRLEILPEYRVPEDLAVFEKWKKGQVNFELEEKHDIWQQKLKSTSARRSNTARQNCPFAASRIYPLRD